MMCLVNKIRTAIFKSSLVLLFFIFSGCNLFAPQEWGWQGSTMGTTYRISIYSVFDGETQAEQLKASVDSALTELNRQMSTYDPQSEISRFNGYHKTEPFPVSEDFANVVRLALMIYKDSGGAFDITVGPLVDLWGFGSKGRRFEKPSPESILRVLQYTGSRHLKVTRENQLIKAEPQLQIDLSAIAKGFGVDVVAGILRKKGFSNFLVEIGGEVFAAGTNKDNKPWRIGIDRPEMGKMPGEDFAEILQISDKAMATSGDYRNYFEVDGKYYSHSIIPRTGYPVKHKLASVTIIAPNCMLADGLATAIMVLGVEKGLHLAETKTDVEALLIERLSKHEFREYFTSGFKKYLDVN